MGPMLYLTVLIWAVTLAHGCSPWPLRIAAMILPPTLGIPHFFHRDHHVQPAEPTGDPIGAAIFFVGGILIITPAFHAMKTARKAMRLVSHLEYPTPDLLTATSVRVAAQITAALPVMVYLTMQSLGGMHEHFDALLRYIQHTPWCTHTPDTPTKGNIPFSGCSPYSDMAEGIASFPVYTSANAFLNRTQAVAAAANRTIDATTLDSPSLFLWDYERLQAIEDTKRYGGQDATSAMLQALVLTVTLFSGQIFLRVARISFEDVAAFEVSAWQMVAQLLSLFLVTLAFMALSISPDQYRAWGSLVSEYGTMGGALLLFIALWRVAAEALAVATRQNAAAGANGGSNSAMQTKAALALSRMVADCPRRILSTPPPLQSGPRSSPGRTPAASASKDDAQKIDFLSMLHELEVKHAETIALLEHRINELEQS